MAEISVINSSEFMSTENQATTATFKSVILPFVIPHPSKGTSDETAGAYLIIEKREDVCQNEPVIRGTRISVALIVELYHLLGWDLQKIRSEYPHLTSGQIYAALDYYDSHTKEIDAYLQKEKEEADDE